MAGLLCLDAGRLNHAPFPGKCKRTGFNQPSSTHRQLARAFPHVKLARMKSRSGWGEIREKSYRAPNFTRKPIDIGSDRTGRADLPAHRPLRLGGKVQLLRSRHLLEPQPMGGCVSSLFGQGQPPLKLLVVHELSHSVLGCALHRRSLHEDEQSARSVPRTGLLARFDLNWTTSQCAHQAAIVRVPRGLSANGSNSQSPAQLTRCVTPS